MGVEPVSPLTLEEMKRPLGPGHKVGPYGWEQVVGRKDGCKLSSLKIRWLQDYFNTAKRKMKSQSYEKFADDLAGNYHNAGHSYISADCPSIHKENAHSLMYFTETSARDSIFWRWHTHLEHIMQEFRDTRFER